MATNFKIVTHQNAGELHLTLVGDFDGSSAWELFNSLKRNSSAFPCIKIHTNRLNHIHQFGLQTFHQISKGFRKKRFQLSFTGEKAKYLSSGPDLRIANSRFDENAREH